MKKYRIAQILTGILFFILAIFFSFSLVFALLDNGLEFSGFLGFLVWTGHLIKESYGLCSILIPLFLFLVSMCCLILQLTFKKCIYISFSLVPFFTAVVSEKIYRASQKLSGPIGVAKLIFTILATLLIMGIEFLVSGIVAERIAFNRRMKDQIRQKVMEPDAEDEFTKTEVIENTIPSQSLSSEYRHAFDDIPLYDKNSDFSIHDETAEEEEDSDLIYSQRKMEEALSEDYDYTDETEEEPESDSDFEITEFEDQSDDTSDFAITETEEEPADASDFAITEFEDQLDDTSDFAITETEEETAAASDYKITEFDDQPHDTSDFAITETEEEPAVIETSLEETGGVSDVFSQMDKDIEEELSFDEQFERELQISQQLEESEDEAEIEEDDSDSEISSEIDSEPEMEPELSLQPDPSVPQVSVKEAEAKIREEKKSTITKRRGAYKVPTEGLLNQFEDQKYWIIDHQTNEAADFLKETLKEFKIDAEVTGIRKGPVVTMFEILPAPGVKLSKIVALQDNIALRLAASSVRIVAPIPGKRAVGIEIPNENRATVTFRELIEQNLPEYKKMAVPVVLGKDIQGEAQLLDIAKTPHLLIAGSTGSGKSVCVNSIILSILYKRSPQEVKMILVDPKIVELKLYNDIPHLLTPVITEPNKALQSLQYCLCEMERRYALLDGLGVRDIINYNKRVEERHIATEKLPYIVVIIDEFADLMATTGKELESTIARLCAMSRAVGIHLVLATQRPSIDVITGLIKANIPTRIAFMVASKMDSRIIIDQVGAEKLLGRGDMLYASATDPFPVRIQGTFVSDQEVENVVEYVKGYGEPEYIDEEIFVESEEDEMGEPGLFGGSGEDPLYNKALEIVMQSGKASASYLQRRLSIGYNRAARLIEDMEARGIVGPPNGSKPREIIHMP